MPFVLYKIYLLIFLKISCIVLFSLMMDYVSYLIL